MSWVGMSNAKSLQLASFVSRGIAEAGACSAAAAKQNAFGNLVKMLLSWLRLTWPPASTAAPAPPSHSSCGVNSNDFATFPPSRGNIAARLS